MGVAVGLGVGAGVGEILYHGEGMCVRTHTFSPSQDSLIGDDIPLPSLVRLVPRFRCFLDPIPNSPPEGTLAARRSCKASSAALPPVSPPEALGGGTSRTRTAGNVLKLAQSTPVPHPILPSYLCGPPNDSDNQPMVNLARGAVGESELGPRAVPVGASSQPGFGLWGWVGSCCL